MSNKSEKIIERIKHLDEEKIALLQELFGEPELSPKEPEKPLLNKLEEIGCPGMKWICRRSSTGRGVRIHQDPGMGKYETPSEAIESFLSTHAKDVELVLGGGEV